MAYTDKLSVVSERLFEKLEQNKDDLGLYTVLYGDQERLPGYPAVCVEPDNKDRDLNGNPRRTLVTLRVFIILYHGAIDSPQVNRRVADQKAEAVEAMIHEDPALTVNNEDLVIHGMVTRMESGYVRKENTLVRASRLTYEANSQVHLPDRLGG